MTPLFNPTQICDLSNHRLQEKKSHQLTVRLNGATTFSNDTQHNDDQHKESQHNVNQHNANWLNDTQHNLD